MESEADAAALPLAFAAGQNLKARQAYPPAPVHAASWDGAALRVTLAEPLSAAVFCLTW